MTHADVVEDAPQAMAVEELSARTGAPVRTIREYQTWQILHPPTRVGRRGFYDESHVRRLEGIARLQERGYSIAAIRDLFEAWEQGEGLRDVLGVDDAIGLPADEAPISISRDQLAELLPAVAGSDRVLARARKGRPGSAGGVAEGGGAAPRCRRVMARWFADGRLAGRHGRIAQPTWMMQGWRPFRRCRSVPSRVLE